MKLNKFAITGICIVLFLANPSNGDTIHVNLLAPCPGDGSETAPFCTLNRALAAAKAGDVIVMKSEIYLEAPLVIDKRLTISASDGHALIRGRIALPPNLLAETSSRYGDDASSPCVNRLVEAVSRPSLDVSASDFSYQIRTGQAGLLGGTFTEHVQGIARLSDVFLNGQRVGRVILTDNIDQAPFPVNFFEQGLIYSEQVSTDGTEALFSSNRTLRAMYSINIRGTYRHPGGAQAHGNTVAIGLEEGRAGIPAAVYFLHFPPGQQGAIVNEVRLNGTHGEPSEQVKQSGASAAAFIKLASGQFLLAVSGADHGKQGIWFYISSDTTITPQTWWSYLDFWEPPCRGGPEKLDECFGGASGMALLADCSGDIHLVNMHGTDREPFRDENQWIQVYRVERTSSGGIGLLLLHSQRDNTGVIQTNNPAFRWAGGAYVTEGNGVAIFNTERRTNERDNDYVDGDVYFSKLKE